MNSEFSNYKKDNQSGSGWQILSNRVKNSGLKLLKVSVWFFIIIVLLIGTTLIIINYLYKEKIIQYAVEQINKQLIVPIQVQKIDLNIWKSFPNASIELDNVIIKSSISENNGTNGINKGDTLLKAEMIYLLLNPLKLLFGTYKINQLSVNNGFIKLYIDEAEKSNFQILKNQGQSKNPANQDLNFNNVLFKNIDFEYYNRHILLLCKGIARKLQINGDYQTDQSWLKIAGDIFIEKVELNSINYLYDKHIKIISSLSISKGLYQIELPKIGIEDVTLSGFGSVDSNHSSLNIELGGNHISIAKLSELLPDHYIKEFRNYARKGTLTLQCYLKGSVDKGNTPSLKASFNVSNAIIIDKNSGIKLSDIYLIGSYSSYNKMLGKEDLLSIPSFSGKLNSGTIKGNVIIRNIVKPIVEVNIFCKLNLSDIKSFLELDSIEMLKGWSEATLSVKGTLPSVSKINRSDFSKLNYDGSIKIKDGLLKIRSLNYTINNLNGELQFKNDIQCNGLNFKLNDNDFTVNGTLTNGVKYFLGDHEIGVLTADISSRNLDLSNYFERSPEVNPSKSGVSRQILFPENISADVKFTINDFKINKFNAKWVTCRLDYKPTFYTIKSLSFESMSGHITGNGLILEDLDKNLNTKGQFDLFKIDIHNMFYVFNNFTQNIITYNNLSGTLSGAINISSQWNKDLVLNDDQLMMDADITIDDGELIDFEYAKGLSKFVSMNELKTIQFNTLKNRITVKDKKVTIPQMDIYTSAFNIKASGEHSFTNHYSYRVKILLSDILWGKAKKHKKENEEFGVVEDDGLGKTTIPLSIVGFDKDYKISYDSKEAFNMFKNKLDNQRNDMRQIFNKEYGWFKKDSSIRKNALAKKQTPGVTWDDENSDPDSTFIKTNKKNKKVRNNEKLKVEWDDK